MFVNDMKRKMSRYSKNNLKSSFLNKFCVSIYVILVLSLFMIIIVVFSFTETEDDQNVQAQLMNIMIVIIYTNSLIRNSISLSVILFYYF